MISFSYLQFFLNVVIHFDIIPIIATFTINLYIIETLILTSTITILQRLVLINPVISLEFE